MDISDLIIDKEFESVIPPLDEQEFELLEESILQDGEIYHPLVVWDNTIVDGHHRYKILERHPGINYRVAKRYFENRYQAISWICLNQLGRRNLSSAQKTVLMGRRYKAEKLAHGASDGFRGNKYKKVVSGQSDHLQNNGHKTAKRIAAEMGTSEKTVRRAEKYVDGMDAAEEVLPGVSKDIISGKIRPKHDEVCAIAQAPIEERKQMAKSLYKELTPEEKERRKKKRDLSKSIEMLDKTHMPSEENKVTQEDMLMTFQCEVKRIMDSMDFYFDYFPELLTEKKYISKIKEILEPLKDYLKKLEENKYATII